MHEPDDEKPVHGAGIPPRESGSLPVDRDGTRLWEFDPVALGILVGTAAVYVGLGYVAFALATRRARRLGVLGDY